MSPPLAWPASGEAVPSSRRRPRLAGRRAAALRALFRARRWRRSDVTSEPYGAALLRWRERLDAAAAYAALPDFMAHREVNAVHPERHRGERLGWLRAAVLGAHDGIVSTASLLVGVAAAGAGRTDLWLVGLAGLAAGAMSMAAGEYVSVSSQADSEQADLARERSELRAQPDSEQQELAAIYVGRGVRPELATQVAQQLMQHDALAAHARDELGISETLRAKPGLAAFASALAFASGASLPLLTAAVAPLAQLLFWLVSTSLLVLVGLGALAARIGGGAPYKAALRVGFWGAGAMALTAGVGCLFGPLA